MSTPSEQPTPKPRGRTTVVWGLALAIAALAAACADAADPLSPKPPAGPQLATATIATITMSLNQQLEVEKLRIAAAQEASKRQYDVLKLEWARLNEQYPKGNPLLLYCDPLQYTGDTKIIGPEGGDMSVGPHKLSIPAGALAKPTVITGEMPVSLNVGVQLSPHGLTFAKGAKLKLSYKHCNRPKTWSEQIVYVDALNNILEWPLSGDENDNGLVDGTIWHFSGYIVAWGRSRQ